MIDILKNWKVLLLIFFVALSLYLISPTTKSGVVITSVSESSPFYGKVNPGDIITWANEKNIKTVDDFYEFENFTGTLRLIVNGKLLLVEINKPGLGISVKNIPTTRIKLGMELVGGTRVLLEPEGNVTDDMLNQIIATLETRINTYGLKEAKFLPVTDVNGNKYVQVEMAGGSLKEIEELLAKQGKFEAKIPKIVKIINGTGELWNHTIYVKDDKILIDGKDVGINQTINIDGIDFQLLNVTDSNIVLMGTVYEGSDIKSVCMQEQPGICASRLLEGKGIWQFMFQVFVSKEGAERFAKITKGMDVIVDPNTGESYLDSKIYLYLDNKLISDLRISADLAGKVYTQPMITGSRKTKEEAMNEKLMLQSILQSGSLPVSLKIVKADEISPTLGQSFIKNALISGLIAAAAVSVVIFLRYRRLKISVPVILTSMSEVIIILGIATLINWTIDLSAIAGIIAAVGTGVDSQIMILDELILGEVRKAYTLKQKIKRAFFIIFGTASTTIAAMIPLMVIGVGLMRGFAITTTIGVLVGIFISRPAFGVIAERIIEKEGLKKENKS